MKKTLIGSLLVASACLVVWGSASAQQLVISGPLDIQGEIAADGDINANSNINLNGDNSKITSPDFAVSQTYSVSINGNVSTPTSMVDALGYYSLCALTSVYIAGQDDKSTDIGECQVYPNSSSFWYLKAVVGGNTDKVQCSATCLNLPFAQPVQ